MVADCSFFLLSTAFTTVCAPYCSTDGSTLLILPLVNGFHDGFRAVLLRGWQSIAHSSTCQRLSRRFARRIALQMAADYSFLHSLMAFTAVCVPYFSADGSRLFLLSLVNGFHDGFRTVLLCGWQQIAHSSARRLSRSFARHIARQITRWIDYSSACIRLCQLFACHMSRRKVSRLICGFTHIFRLSITLLTFYVP